MIQAAKIRFGLGFALALLLGAVAAPANAGFILTLESEGTTVTIADNMADDLDARAGAISYFGSIGEFDLILSGGVSKPFIENKMDLFSLTVSGSGGTLIVSLTDTDFDQTVSRAGFGIGGTTTGTVGYEAFLDDSNAEFGMGTSLGSGVGSGAFKDSQGTDVSPAGLFSLTGIATITHTGSRDITSFDMLVQVPEPGTLGLVGIGLLALGMVRRKRA